MADVQNNANAVPTAAEAPAPATVVAAVTQPETVQTVNLVAQSDTKAAKDEKKSTDAPSDNNKQPSTTNAQNAGNPASTTFRGQPDDFYSAIFYFSGMGSVIGSALSEGVYVAEQYRKNAIDADDIQQERQAALTKIRGNGPLIGYDGQIRDDVVITARGQAQNLSTDFQKLQTLLESLPVFTGNPDQLPPTGGDRRGGEIDQPIHGELYFRCKERFPVQPTSSSVAVSRQMQPSPHDSLRSGASGDFTTHQQVSEIRRRQNYDDAVLADVARAAVDAFPLMPPPRQPGSRGSATPVQELQQQDDQASRRARRRDANSAVTASSPSPSGFGYQQQYGRGTPTSSLQSPHVY